MYYQLFKLMSYVPRSPRHYKFDAELIFIHTYHSCGTEVINDLVLLAGFYLAESTLGDLASSSDTLPCTAFHALMDVSPASIGCDTLNIMIR